MRLRALTMAAAMLALAACGPAPDAADVNTAEAEAVANLALPPADLAPGAAPAERTTAANGREYVELAGGANLFEIEAARIALEKSQNAPLRALAQALLADHERSTRELDAAGRRATPPISATPAMTPAQQANVQALRDAAGAAFDQLYLEQQVNAHEQALTVVTDYAAGGEVPELRQHASAAAGPIYQHLTRARALAEPAAAPAQPKQ